MTLFDRKDTSICPHLADLMSVGVKAEPVDPPQQSRQSEIENRFNDLVRWGAKAQGAKRRRVAAPQCHQCSAPLSKPWSCLTCPFSGCMPLSSVSSSRRCMRSHWESKAACSFAVDPTTGAIFCQQCDDIVVSDHFDRLHKLALARVEEAHDISKEISIIGKGRERGEFKPWVAPSEGLALDTVKNPCRGLRPLLNLSQTCFLSAVLQALIHNPLLRAYFLSDKHNRHVCSNGSRSLGTGRPYLGPDGTVGPDRDKGCMCCELDRAFEEFHNEDKSPYGPITMLYSMWHASTELEGYGQQDAHSFFLAALDQIHAHAKGQLSSCNCIAHQTFAGSLLSSVTCSKCHTTSTTIDPILDVQLDFPTDSSDMSALTLTDMLKRFCAAEKVGDATKGYDCSSCGGGAGVVAERKLAIKKLAPVLSFQLKRFAHNATSTKVESPVRFPSQLNMQPYVEPPAAGQKALPPSLFEYDLFAVVTHEGKLDNGHYWADVLSGDEWWHCDDDKVTPTTLKDVLSQRAYMLFYVKRSLAYAQPMSKTLGAVQSLAPSGTSTQSPAKPPTSLPPILASPQAEKAPPIAGRTGHPITGMAV